MSAGGVRLRSLPWNTEVRVFGERLVLSGSVQGSQNLGQEIILAQVPAGLWPLRNLPTRANFISFPRSPRMLRNDVTGAHRTESGCYWVVQKSFV